MIENPKIRISIENPLSNIFDLYSYQKNILINEKFITAFFIQKIQKKLFQKSSKYLKQMDKLLYYHYFYQKK